MLETKLEELKLEMVELRAAIVTLTASMQPSVASSTPPSTTTEAKTESVVEMMRAELAKPAKQDEVKVDRDDLQDLCMVIVRNDRTKKADVKAAIASFGGAATLKDVADQDLAALKALLEAMQ